MGTEGFRRAVGVRYAPGSVIVEVGFQRARGPGETPSTLFLASLGPEVHVFEVDPEAAAEARELAGVVVHEGRAEDLLAGWTRPVGFAWLDGHDWPYAHAEAADPEVYAGQRAEYRARGQEYSREASAASHLRVVELLAPHVIQGGLVAFDDTWRVPSPLDDEGDALAAKDLRWNGKGRWGVPYLRYHRNFQVMEEEDIFHGLVVLRRE